ncbi:MAG TPA: hypothetical protein PLK99_09505, partial [Burkholderiales bacterium]|nr:hypothetical protein [Burkholderiales bacterium]
TAPVQAAQQKKLALLSPPASPPASSAPAAARPEVPPVRQERHFRKARPLEKPIEKTLTREARPEERSEQLYRKALESISRGGISEGEADLREALQIEPDRQSVRQALTGLLLQQ